MTDDQYNEILPEITEADAQTILEAAGEIAERPAADLRDALEILAGDDPEPLEYIRICLAFNAESAGDQERHDALLKKIHERQREQLGQEYDALIEAAGRVQAIIREVKSATDAAIEPARAISEVVESIRNLYESFTSAIDDVLPEWAKAGALTQFYEELDTLEPFINAELQKRPDMEGKTLNDLLMPLPFRVVFYATKGEPVPDTDDCAAEMNAFIEIIKAAREAQAIKNLPTVKYKPADNQQIQLNIDKLTARLFNPRTMQTIKDNNVTLYYRDPQGGYKTKRGEIPGQLSFIPISYEKAGNEEITLYYALDYDKEKLKELGLKEETTAEDFFILSVIADAVVSGNTEISPANLYKAFTGKAPNTEQRTQFVNRLMKMASTMVDIDDRQVMRAWGNETYNQYYGQLAPLKFINKRHVVNGGVVDGIIKITDFPDVLRTGQQIKQYITVPKSLLHVTKKDKKGKLRAVRRTPRFYEILMLLLKRIAMIKNGKVNKILYASIYEKLGIDPKDRKDANARQDTLETVFVILDHFKREGWITGYKEERTKSTGDVGIKITWKDADGKDISNKKKVPQKRIDKPKKTP